MYYGAYSVFQVKSGCDYYLEYGNVGVSGVMGWITGSNKLGLF